MHSRCPRLRKRIEPSHWIILSGYAFDLGKKQCNEWCQGPESNWLRPPFQGGALPMSYPGTCGLEIVWGAARLCQFNRTK
jgi:hypothetical protein